MPRLDGVEPKATGSSLHAAVGGFFALAALLAAVFYLLPFARTHVRAADATAQMDSARL